MGLLIKKLCRLTDLKQAELHVAFRKTCLTCNPQLHQKELFNTFSQIIAKPPAFQKLVLNEE